jgi:uncharacterized protein
MPDQFVGLIIIGLVAGLASGMFGIGGGVIIVPVLITFLGFSQLEANGTSLAALLAPVGIFAVLAYWRAGKLQFKTAVLISIGLAIGGFFGAEIALGLPRETLKQIYGAFLLYVAWRFGEPRKFLAERAQSNAASANPSSEAESEPIKAPWYGLLVLGFAAGIISGLFGVGGGIVIVPALIGLLHFEQKRAVGTSLGALLFPAALPAAIQYYNRGQLDVGVAVFVA